MNNLSEFLYNLGSGSLNVIWFPLLTWTILSVAIIGILRKLKHVPALYQYHIRVAILMGLPSAIILSYFVNEIIIGSAIGIDISSLLVAIESSILNSSSAEAVIENKENLLIGTLSFWTGVFFLILAAGAVINLLRNVIDHFRLAFILNNTRLHPVSQLNSVSDSNQKLIDSIKRKPLVGYSDGFDIPFTTGFLKPVIVIPSAFQEDQNNFNMALRHELIHIKRYDYLLNLILIILKSIVWFHPLIHNLYRDTIKFCEISCDREVLLERNISPKKYAGLLFDLAGKQHKNRFAINGMAINNSTLTERIKTMKNTVTEFHSSSKSILLSMICFALITGLISCTDIQSPELSEEDLTEMQTRIESEQTGDDPVFIFEGRDFQITAENSAKYKMNKAILNELKNSAESIENIQVWKGKAAIDKFGEEAKNGVIQIKFKDSGKLSEGLNIDINELRNSLQWNKATFEIKEDPPPPPVPSDKTDKIIIKESPPSPTSNSGQGN